MDEDTPLEGEHKLKFGVEAILAMKTSNRDEQDQQRDFNSDGWNQIYTFLPPLMSNIYWPSSLRNRTRRGMLRRAVFTEEQRQGLEFAFLQHRYITKPERKKLAQHLTLKDSQVSNSLSLSLSLFSDLISLYLGEDLVRRLENERINSKANFRFQNRRMKWRNNNERRKE